MNEPSQQDNRGLWLGLLGVVIFAVTVPLTRLAVGSETAPQLSGAFVATGRAALAAVLSAFFLWATHAKRPQRADWWLLALVALGIVFGFPLCMSIAMRHLQAVHASVMLGVLPLATAMVGALIHRQRPSLGFWFLAALGAVLVMAFAISRSGETGLVLSWADGLLLLAMACAATGYGVGARLSSRMRADHVICWALVISLPVNAPLALLYWPQQSIELSAWASFVYLAVFSQWLGFFAWYRGLALGGTVRVSQVQLLQPFFSMVFAVLLLGERIEPSTLGFAAAVILVVFIGRKMPLQRAAQ